MNKAGYYPEISRYVRAVQSEVSRAEECLLRPTAISLNQCCAILENARTLLAGVCESAAQVRPNQTHAVTELSALRGQITRVAALLDSAAAYRGAWSRCVATLAAGYLHDGSAGAAPRLSRFSIEV